MGRGYNPDRHVIELFPDASYCASGLDSGKWITEKYKFDFKHAFYTTVSDGKTNFVDGRNWKKTLEILKELEDKVIV